jgi:hypothetical protein
MRPWQSGSAALFFLLLILSAGTARGFHLAERTGPIVIERNGRHIETGDFTLHTGDSVRIEGTGQALLRDTSGRSIALGGGSALVMSVGSPGRQAFRVVSGLVRLTSPSPSKVTAPHLQLWCTRADLLVYVVQDVTTVFVLSGKVLTENAHGVGQVLGTGKRLISTGDLYESGSFDVSTLEELLDKKDGLARPGALSVLVTNQGNGRDGRQGARQQSDADATAASDDPGGGRDGIDARGSSGSERPDRSVSKDTGSASGNAAAKVSEGIGSAKAAAGISGKTGTRGAKNGEKSRGKGESVGDRKGDSGSNQGKSGDRGREGKGNGEKNGGKSGKGGEGGGRGGEGSGRGGGHGGGKGGRR